MKALLSLILILLATHYVNAQKVEIVNKTDNSITFVVDKDLPKPQKRLELTNLSQEMRNQFGAVATSFDDEFLFRERKDVMFQFFINAYTDHRSIVLSPDIIWITICQGFARYANKHSEQLRPMIVEHEGKKKLVVELFAKTLDEVDWNMAIDMFTEQIHQNTKNDIAKTITANFSTTGQTERISSEITLMDCVENYFDYELVIATCGIPTVTLTGTADDWRLVLEKTEQLSQYGLAKWVKKLTPILSEFIKAAEGNPNRYFWRCMVNHIPVTKLNSPGCNPHGDPPDYIDGWFLKFFPDENGKTLSTIKWTSNSESSQVYVPFNCIIKNSDGTVESEFPMEFVAGIVGIAIDSETGTLTPRIGWIVRKERQEKDLMLQDFENE